MEDKINLPTNFKVIGFGEEAKWAVSRIKEKHCDALSIQQYSDNTVVEPADTDVMAILLITGDMENAVRCAKTFYQAGVLTVALCADGISIPVNCCDTQTDIPIYRFHETVSILLNTVFNGDGYICVDFHDLETLLRDSRKFIAVEVHGFGAGRIDDATREVKEYMEDIFAGSARNAIVILYFNKNSSHPLVMGEIAHLSNYLDKLSDDIDIMWGLYHDDTIADDSVRLAVMLSGEKINSGVR